MRLIATDLDGTLLRSDGSISRRTRTLLVSLRERDIPLVIGVGAPTARPAPDWRAYRRRGHRRWLQWSADLRSHIRSPYYPRSLAAFAEGRHATRHRSVALPDAYFAIECGLRDGRERGYLAVRAIRGRQPEDESLIADALELCSVPVSKLLMRHPTLSADEMLAFGRKVAGNDAVATHSGARLLEISAVGVDKASALAALCGRMGIASSNVVAFLATNLTISQCCAGRGTASLSPMRILRFSRWLTR